MAIVGGILLYQKYLGKCSMSDKKKFALAQMYLADYEKSIIDSKYGGGENIYFDVLGIDYNCSKGVLSVLTKFSFTGQISGLNYWAKGVLTIDINTGRGNFRDTELDPALESALKIQNILTQKGLEFLLNPGTN